MPKYKVPVDRTVIKRIYIDVEAGDALEAEDKALDAAGDHDFVFGKDMDVKYESGTPEEITSG